MAPDWGDLMAVRAPAEVPEDLDWELLEKEMS